jgi:hypothetical protein
VEDKNMADSDSLYDDLGFFTGVPNPSTPTYVPAASYADWISKLTPTIDESTGASYIPNVVQTPGTVLYGDPNLANTWQNTRANTVQGYMKPENMTGAVALGGGSNRIFYNDGSSSDVLPGYMEQGYIGRMPGQSAYAGGNLYVDSKGGTFNEDTSGNSNFFAKLAHEGGDALGDNTMKVVIPAAAMAILSYAGGQVAPALWGAGSAAATGGTGAGIAGTTGMSTAANQALVSAALSGTTNYAQTGDFDSALKAGALSGALSYAGNTLSGGGSTGTGNADYKAAINAGASPAEAANYVQGIAETARLSTPVFDSAGVEIGQNTAHGFEPGFNAPGTAQPNSYWTGQPTGYEGVAERWDLNQINNPGRDYNPDLAVDPYADPYSYNPRADASGYGENYPMEYGSSEMLQAGADLGLTGEQTFDLNDRSLGGLSAWDLVNQQSAANPVTWDTPMDIAPPGPTTTTQPPKISIPNPQPEPNIAGGLPVGGMGISGQGSGGGGFDGGLGGGGGTGNVGGKYHNASDIARALAGYKRIKGFGSDYYTGVGG